MSSKHFRSVKGPSQKPPRPLSPVDLAGPNDLDALLEFLAAVRDEIDGGRVELEVMATIARELVNRVRGVAFIVRGPFGVEASLGLRAESPLLSRTHHLRSTWYVVAPEARATGHAKSLLLEGQKLAASIGRPLLIEELTPDIANGKAALIGRHLKTAGTVFCFSPPVAV